MFLSGILIMFSIACLLIASAIHNIKTDVISIEEYEELKRNERW